MSPAHPASPSAPVAPVLGASVDVHVPATSANLGPGFDAFGLALAYGDDLSARVVPAGTHASGARVTVSGEGAESLPSDGTHLAAVTIRGAWDRWGVDHSGVDLELEATNRIPHGRGQGSSAAVVVAALWAAASLLPAHARPGRDAVFQLAAATEGHPDNVAPAVFGGFTISWSEPGQSAGEAQARPAGLDAAVPGDADGQSAGFGTAVLEVHPELVALVAIPDVKLATALARGLLPAQVPHADAAANSGNAALLVHAMTSRPSLLFQATRDLLHEGYRAPAMPHSAALIAALRERGFAATVSGAGPTVLVLARTGQGGDAEAARAALDQLTQDGSVRWRVLEPGIDTVGATVRVHQPLD
ncbi:homoserine kinase [Galactobacter caseinivorans]|uniref:Homoserine kinase n=1 Tax=Galactobacter caseinivorans TaxID=2676123 RepID=A0A496PMV3_9MICC|nr:homoserine kinase [Galactobacter caseinivorans]